MTILIELNDTGERQTFDVHDTDKAVQVFNELLDVAERLSDDANESVSFTL